MPKKTLHMETTSISTAKTVSEIMAEMGEYPFVIKISQSFNNGAVSSVEFSIKDESLGVTHYRLEPRSDEIFTILQQKRLNAWEWTQRDREQAPKVAWRQIYRWVQAQLAMVDAKQAVPQELFFSQMIDGRGNTMFQKFVAFKALPPASES